jgi:hypothetical protein
MSLEQLEVGEQIGVGERRRTAARAGTGSDRTAP